MCWKFQEHSCARLRIAADIHVLELERSRGLIKGFQVPMELNGGSSPWRLREALFMKQILHTIPETGKLLGVSRTLIYSLIAHGDLDRVKLRNRAMVTRNSIEKLIERSGAPAGGRS